MNKLIVVTGGTKGIGRAIVNRFARADFDVVTCARNRQELEQMEKQIAAEYPLCNIIVHQADMSDKQQVKKFCDAVTALQRPVDVLVNNAGYFIPGEISTEAEGTLESMIQGNLYSAYYATRGLVEGMKERRSGYIFNMCSIASIKAYPNGGSYAISKFALLGLTRCLREELKPHGIRVTAILPGATWTSSWEGAGLPEDRLMPVEDIAESVFTAYSLSARSVVEEILLRPFLGDI